MSSISGNKNPSNEGKSPPECYQEDALDYDSYEEEDAEGPYKTREQKLQMLKQLDNKGHCSWRLEQVYPDREITTCEKLGKHIQQFERFKNQIEHKGCCESKISCDETKK